MRADQLTLFVEDSHVKTSALQENDVDLRESAVDFGSSLRASLMRLNPSGSSLKTCQVYSLAMEDETLPSSFSGWQSAGMAWGGECLTVKALDLPSDANVCLLSQVLEHHVDARLESESVRWDNSKSRGERKSDTRAVAKRLGIDVGYALRANPSASGDKGDGGINTTLVPVAKCLTAHGQRIDYESETMIPFAIQGNIVDRQRGGANCIGISQSNISYTLTAVDRHAVAVQDIAPTLRAEAKQSLMSGDGNINAPLAIGALWESTHGDDPVRLCSNQNLSPTLPARMGTGGNSVPLIGVRRLTPTECERLQGFPDGWTSGQSDTHRYKQLGNAVSVPVAEWIGRRIMQA